MSPAEPVLMVHCFYQRPGGEDTAYRAESRLLEERGHRVARLELHNAALEPMSLLGVAARTLWNRDAARLVAEQVRTTGARLVHFHNTFPLASPAVYSAARRAGARVVQTLYNYRLVCPSALMLRDGAPCESCSGRAFAWPAVRHACYRDSRAASAVVATMLTAHRAAGTWTREVDAFIAVSAFLREKVIRGGLPPERVHVKGPHLADDPGPGAHAGGYALFVGRLSAEKGIGVLLEAWRRLQADVPLHILGDGPLRETVERAAADDARITFEGHVDGARVREAMQSASLLLVPSIWYEGAPLVFAEAAAAGLPVVASRIGGIAECVDEGETGVLLPPGDAQRLAQAVACLLADPGRLRTMCSNARRRFEGSMSAACAYDRLNGIYDAVLQAA